MNNFAITFFVVSGLALLILPRRLALFSLLVGACYMTMGSGISILSFNFTVLRMLVALGFMRIFIRGERISNGMNGLDWSMLTWAAWALACSLFYTDLSAALKFRLGLVYDACGIYFLLRVFCQSIDDVIGMCRLISFLLIPVAIEMLYEHFQSINLFFYLGDLNEISQVRGGKIRASGPFAHPITAGTVGAVCLPLIVGLWQRHRREAALGLAACLSVVYLSSSSGPIMSALSGVGALIMWNWRQRMRVFQWLAILCYIGLGLFMKDPAYYIMARFDFTGSSAGWHRARLIESAIEHISEWWIAGTDYTRHWMPTGVIWSPDHTDITNQFLSMGVVGGLPLMFLFIIIMAKGFIYVGQLLQKTTGKQSESLFFFWAIGASLFSHITTFLSVAYFDQSFVFIYVTLAAIGSSWSGTAMQPKKEGRYLTNVTTSLTRV